MTGCDNPTLGGHMPILMHEGPALLRAPFGHGKMRLLRAGKGLLSQSLRSPLALVKQEGLACTSCAPWFARQVMPFTGAGERSILSSHHSMHVQAGRPPNNNAHGSNSAAVLAPT